MNPQNMHSNELVIIVNGQEQAIPVSSTVADFLQIYNITAARVVAQLNGKIIPRDEYAKAHLRHGDHLEIVTLVGGG